MPTLWPRCVPWPAKVRPCAYRGCGESCASPSSVPCWPAAAAWSRHDGQPRPAGDPGAVHRQQLHPLQHRHRPGAARPRAPNTTVERAGSRVAPPCRQHLADADHHGQGPPGQLDLRRDPGAEPEPGDRLRRRTSRRPAEARCRGAGGRGDPTAADDLGASGRPAHRDDVDERGRALGRQGGQGSGDSRRTGVRRLAGLPTTASPSTSTTGTRRRRARTWPAAWCTQRSSARARRATRSSAVWTPVSRRSCRHGREVGPQQLSRPRRRR